MSDQFIRIVTKNNGVLRVPLRPLNSNTENGPVTGSAPRNRFVVVNKAKVCDPPNARPQPLAKEEAAPVKAAKNPPKAGIWTNEQTYDLIREYQKHPCLYNDKHPDYLNREHRMQAMAKVMKAMEHRPNTTEDQVRVKWNLLRNQFQKDFKKSQVKKTGSGAEEVHKPTNFFYEDLMFLKDCVTVKGSVSNLDHHEEDLFDSLINEEEVLDGQPTHKVAAGPPCKKQRKQSNDNDDSRFFDKAGKLLDNISEKISTRPVPPQPEPQPQPQNRDHFDTLSTYIASKLRSLPPEEAQYKEEEILRALLRP